MQSDALWRESALQLLKEMNVLHSEVESILDDDACSTREDDDAMKRFAKVVDYLKTMYDSARGLVLAHNRHVYVALEEPGTTREQGRRECSDTILLP